MHSVHAGYAPEQLTLPDGEVSDIEAISGPTEGGLREEAVRVIKKSGKWVPAISHGRKVKSYKRQPIIFMTNQDILR